MVALPGGFDAVPAMGGIGDVRVPLFTAQVVFFLDLLFPLTFGCGFILLSYSFRTDTNEILVYIISAVMLIAIVSDFIENALAFNRMIGEETSLIQWPATVIKYSTIAFSGILLSFCMPTEEKFGSLVTHVLRYIFPVASAILMSGITGKFSHIIVGASFPFVLLLLAYYARNAQIED